MTIDILTLFPAMFMGPFDESIVRRAMDKQLVQIHIHNLRKWAIDARGTVDDKPYGGGAGMVAQSHVLTSNASTTASPPRRDSSCARRARVRADSSSALIRPNRQLGSNTGSGASAPTSSRNAASLAAAT